jgi:GDP-4-dehydro-6-deoxy-D-mannose reductase
MKILVTGADGFVGRHLSAALRRANHDIVEPGAPQAPDGLELTDFTSVRSTVERARPDAIVHLAAVSSVAESHQEPGRTFAVNAVGTTHLLAAIRQTCPRARLLLISSGEVYGRAAARSPTSEDAPLEPLSPYAASKVAGEVSALQFHHSYGTDVVIARPFGHLGAGQALRFVIPSFAEQIAAFRRNGTADPVLRTGDLSPIRDFLHVEDVVASYALLLEHGVPGVAYNVGSGVGRSVRSLLDEMLELAAVKARVEIDPARVRPVEIPVLVGDSSRLAALGWKPRRDVRSALREVLEEHAAL